MRTKTKKRTNLKVHRACACHGVNRVQVTNLSVTRTPVECVANGWVSIDSTARVIGAMTCEAVKLCMAELVTITEVITLCTPYLVATERNGKRSQSARLLRHLTRHHIQRRNPRLHRHLNRLHLQLSLRRLARQTRQTQLQRQPHRLKEFASRNVRSNTTGMSKRARREWASRGYAGSRFVPIVLSAKETSPLPRLRCLAGRVVRRSTTNSLRRAKRARERKGSARNAGVLAATCARRMRWR